MWPRFQKQDLGIIAHYLGSMVLLLGAIMVVPLVVSLIMREGAIAGNYLIGMGCAITIGALLRLCRISPATLERRQAIAITALVWIVGATVAAIPLWLSGHYGSYLDALFEGVSGFTSTGFTLCQDIDHLSIADNMWRFAMQFLGGQGVIVIALSLGIFSKVGSSFYSAEGRTDFVLPNIKKTAQFIWQFSSIVVLCGTVLLTVVALFLGIDPIRSIFHGLWLTIGAYDTGGFAAQSLSLMYYHSWPLEAIAMVLMCMGAVNFALYARIWKGGFRSTIKEFTQDIEIRTLAIWTTLVLIVFVAAILAGHFLTDFAGLARRAVFTIVSATTNTGYQVLSTNQITSMLTSGAFFMLILGMAIGGSSGSTAGGIKALRIGIIAKAIIARIKDVLAPKSARNTTSYQHLGRHLLSNETTGAVMTITLLYLLTYLIGAIIGIAAGYEAIPATFESVAATSNAGLSAGIISPSAPAGMKILYMVQMWVGRLEFLTILAVLTSFIASLKPRRRVKK
ncbi:MAG: TrkH family potassium uptake protein [Coriobacteriia bacterium]|nr:TrkH family potassium uptake protein [Coriobacteriia bacterium]